MARKKPVPENRKVKSGGHVRVHAGRTKKTHPNTYAREYRPYGPTQREKPEAYVWWYVSRRRKRTAEGKQKRQHTRDARKESEESTMDDQQPDRWGTQKFGVGLRDETHKFRARLACHVSANMRGGAGG